jgi:hypothetical protein
MSGASGIVTGNVSWDASDRARAACATLLFRVRAMPDSGSKKRRRFRRWATKQAKLRTVRDQAMRLRQQKAGCETRSQVAPDRWRSVSISIDANGSSAASVWWRCKTFDTRGICAESESATGNAGECTGYKNTANQASACRSTRSARAHCRLLAICAANRLGSSVHRAGGVESVRYTRTEMRWQLDARPTSTCAEAAQALHSRSSTHELDAMCSRIGSSAGGKLERSSCEREFTFKAQAQWTECKNGTRRTQLRHWMGMAMCGSTVRRRCCISERWLRVPLARSPRACCMESGNCCDVLGTTSCATFT